MNEFQAILTALEGLGGKNITFTLTDVINLLSGNPLSVQVDPLTVPVGTKSLVVSLASNAVTLQLH